LAGFGRLGQIGPDFRWGIMPIPLLQVRGLTVRYRLNSGDPVAAVQDVSFHIAPGETVGLMGESGCGKSSVALAVVGLLAQPAARVNGSIFFRGVDLLPLGARELREIRGAAISIIYQEPEMALNPVMRVGDQVAEVIRAHRPQSWKQCRLDARAMLDRVGFGQVERIYNAYSHQLSGGQRQRIVIAQALACNPALLIADEPTAHLDVRSQSELLGLLETLKRESGISMLLISHTAEVQSRMADRLLMMQAGRIVNQGQASELAGNSRDRYTRAILGSAVLRPNSDERVLEELAAQ
jgi:peptide/nickel transport system ATP-binding protein